MEHVVILHLVNYNPSSGMKYLGEILNSLAIVLIISRLKAIPVFGFSRFAKNSRDRLILSANCSWVRPLSSRSSRTF